jgi:hypothetical protein
MYVSNGDEPNPAVPFLPPNANAQGLLVFDDTAYVATINCPPGLECVVDFDGNGQCDMPSDPPVETITAAGGGGCDASNGDSTMLAALLLILLGIVVRPRVRARVRLRARSR